MFFNVNGKNKALLQVNFKVVQIAPKLSYDPKNPHDYLKGLNYKNLGHFRVNSNFSLFLAKIKFFAIFCDFFTFCCFLTLNTEKTVVDEPCVRFI